MTSRVVVWSLGTTYEANFSIADTRSFGSSLARSVANASVVKYSSMTLERISRTLRVMLFGVPGLRAILILYIMCKKIKLWYKDMSLI